LDDAARRIDLGPYLAHGALAPGHQGLTLVHLLAQLEPCLTHKNTLHTLNTP
jgi:hypothetical protein